jgi:hypothetical protein
MEEVFINGVKYVPAPPIPEGVGFDQALASRMTYGDLGEITIREYLHKLLSKLWREEGGFSGKRPFGSSGWTLDLVYSLVHAEMIPGDLERDEDGYIEDATYDKVFANQYVSDLIDYCFFGQG